MKVSKEIYERKLNKIIKTKEPEILTANTYFWKGNGNASQRNRNAEKRHEEVAQFFKDIGLVKIEINNDNVTARTRENQKESIEVSFHYHESRNNVYKSLEVYRDGKKSNIKTLRKLYVR